MSSIAALLKNNPDSYESTKIRDLWYNFLIDQFHDVLPGTCIGMVYEDIKEKE